MSKRETLVVFFITAIIVVFIHFFLIPHFKEVEGYRSNAISSLERARHSVEGASIDAYLVRAFLKRGGFTFADIGTDEEELNKLEKQSYKLKAISSLERARHSVEGASIDAYLVRAFLKRGGFTFADIGTSEKELAQLEKS
ncbi:MAG: hypothetical protein PHO48_03010 [Candidatus Gracilibacteria bacterium]|nr:hypothetical protein [Candidatus Gracilibacteria bacterium]MDD5179038.1 hypothetical protein [Candidatus Gracilibacteria bacterium]